MVVPERLKLIADALGEDVAFLSISEAADVAIMSVLGLLRDIQLPTNLRELEIDRKDVPKLAKGLLEIPEIRALWESSSHRKMTEE